MNSPALILWLIPGYLSILLYRRLNPLPSKQGWEWIFQAASAALICFLTARGILAAMMYLGSDSFVQDARGWWASQFPLEYTFSLALGIFPGTLIATLTMVLLRRAADRFIKLLSRFSWVPTDDIVYFRLLRLKGLLVFVTMKTGKVYVGGLDDFTNHLDAPERHIVITPIMSGYRDKENHQVVFTTEYMGGDLDLEDAEPERVAAEPILIPMSEITALSQFNEELHNRFVQRGTTVMRTAPVGLVTDAQGAPEAEISH